MGFLKALDKYITMRRSGAARVLDREELRQEAASLQAVSRPSLRVSSRMALGGVRPCEGADLGDLGHGDLRGHRP